MHDYFAAFYDFSTVWSVIPSFLLATVILCILSVKLIKPSRNFFIFILLFWILRVGIAITAPLNGFFPVMGDTYIFSYMIANNELPPKIDFPISVLSYFYITFPIRLLSFFDIQSFLIYQQLFYFLSAFLLLRAVELYYSTSEVVLNLYFKYFFITLFLLYPAGIIYTSVPLREVFVMFALSLTIYGFIINQVRRQVLVLLIGLLLLALLRRQFVAVLLICWFAVKYYKYFWFYLLIPIIVSVSLLLFELALYEITPSKLSKIRLAWSDAHGDQVYGLFNWGTWFDLLKDYPSLMLQYIASPLPILHSLNPFSMKAALIDSLYTIPIIFISIFMLLFNRYRITPFFIVSMVFLFISCIWEAYVGGAVRHRMTTVLPLIPLVALFLSNALPYRFKQQRVIYGR